MVEKALDLLAEKQFSQLKQELSGLNPVEIADIMSAIPQESLSYVFRLLPKKLAAEAFAEMDNDLQESLIQALSDVELSDILSDLFLDDTVDIIEEMPANVVKRILRQSDPESRKKINEILQYPEDSAGSIMTTEYVDLKKDMTVKEAFSRIRLTGVDKETIYTCYVTDSNRKLEGLVSVKDLLLANEEVSVAKIMQTHIISVSTLDDKEYVSRQLQKYDFMAIPVTDRERRLVGIITFDDAMDVLQDESTEDIEKMAAITPGDKPYLKTGTFELWKRRIPWLLILMISATFTGKIIQSFESALSSQVVLASFIPMLMDTGGNAGSQTSVTVIRGLSLGEMKFSDIFVVIWKEIRVAVLCGVTLSLCNLLTRRRSP